MQDISFHLTQLRKRVGEISSEIRRMHQEHGQLQKDTSTHDTLQRRYDDCIKDVCSAICANALLILSAIALQVRNLEGELADYNLAMDKARTSVDPAEVTRFQAQLAAHNKDSEQQIDHIFVERQEREQGVHRLEQQIQEVRTCCRPGGVASLEYRLHSRSCKPWQSSACRPCRQTNWLSTRRLWLATVP